MTQRLNIDPITGKKRLEIIDMVEQKIVLDENKLQKQKKYLEDSIVNFQAQLVLVNKDLTTIANAQ